MRRAVINVNLDPGGQLKLDQIQRAVAALRHDGHELVAGDLDRLPPTKREIELLHTGDDVAELRRLAERACAGAFSVEDGPVDPKASTVAFMSSGTREDALGIVRAFGLGTGLQEIHLVDEDVAVLVLTTEALATAPWGKLQTALEAGLNREIQIVAEQQIPPPSPPADSAQRRYTARTVTDPTSAAPVGRREQRKRLTREDLLRTASELFAERGYDDVTVAEIASGAGVSVKTLFQYFRSKEDLLLAELDSVHERLVAAIRDRDMGQPPVAVLRDWLLSESLNTPEEGIGRFDRTVGKSQSIAALRRRLYEDWENAIVEVLAHEANEARPTPQTRLEAAMLVSMVRVTSSPEVNDFILSQPVDDRRAAFQAWVNQAAQLIAGGMSPSGALDAVPTSD